jgi:methyl-accepting chemotaxis protein
VRYAHARIYQLLAWVNGSFAQNRLDALNRQIHQGHDSIEQQLRQLGTDMVASDDAAERQIVEQSRRAGGLPQGRAGHHGYGADGPEHRHQCHGQAEQQFLLLNDPAGALSTLEQQLSAQAHQQARRLPAAQHRHGRAGAAVVRCRWP